MTNLSVQERNSTLVVDSRLIAGRLGIDHRAFIQTLKKHQDKIEARFGVITFEMSKPPEGSTGGRPEKYALLTEPQATTLMTFSRNTEQVVGCKLDLVHAFEEAKQVIKTVIPQQSERIRELELQLAIAQAQADAAKQARLYAEFNHSVATLHGASMLALIQGRPEAVVEKVVEVKEVVLCTEDGKPIIHSKGISKTALAKELGLKKAEKLVSWLKSMGKEDLLVDGKTALPCQYVPYENLGEVKRLWANQQGERQRLIGE